MDLIIDAFDKALIIKIKGETTVEDIKTFDEELPALYGEFPLILISLDGAQIQPGLAKALTGLRDRHGFKKDRLIVVSKNHLDVDFRSFAEALESINTSDALRLADFLEARKKLKRLEKELQEKKISYANVLRVAAGKNDSEELLTPDEEKSLRRLFEDRLKKAQFLHRVVGGQIALMKKTQLPQVSEEAQSESISKLKSLQSEIVNALRKAGVLA